MTATIESDAPKAASIRVATYNIHGCVDTTRKVNIDKIVEIIGNLNADALALQEVDVQPSSRGNRNQARAISERLGLAYRYLPVEKNERHAFGLAVLSPHPVEGGTFFPLPNLFPGLKMRKRGVMRVTIQTPWGAVDLVNTHLSVFRLERHVQLNALVRFKVLSSHPDDTPLIVCGDFNARPSSLLYRRIIRFLTDVHGASNPFLAPQGTFPSKAPAWRIDHIFVSRHLVPLHTEVVKNFLAVNASDHLPLLADLAFADGPLHRGDRGT